MHDPSGSRRSRRKSGFTRVFLLGVIGVVRACAFFVFCGAAAVGGFFVGLGEDGAEEVAVGPEFFDDGVGGLEAVGGPSLHVSLFCVRRIRRIHNRRMSRDRRIRRVDGIGIKGGGGGEGAEEVVEGVVEGGGVDAGLAGEGAIVDAGFGDEAGDGVSVGPMGIRLVGVRGGADEELAGFLDFVPVVEEGAEGVGGGVPLVEEFGGDFGALSGVWVVWTSMMVEGLDEVEVLDGEFGLLAEGGVVTDDGEGSVAAAFGGEFGDEVNKFVIVGRDIRREVVFGAPEAGGPGRGGLIRH